MNVLGSIYGAAVSWRRRWYASDSSRVRRLSRPVISVGNLRAGGSGKTPVVAHIARLLVAHGERPAILTRGYGRPDRRAAMTVVSDGTRIFADFAAAGDEPLMLARALPGVCVVVGADRYRAGREAETVLDASVHLLDDGFQHIGLARDADLLLCDRTDLSERMLPAGRLREPLGNARAADALLVTEREADDLPTVAAALAVDTAFAVRRRLEAPVWLAAAAPAPGGLPQPASLPRDTPVLAFAGIARAGRFFDDLAAAGYVLTAREAFRDHYRYAQGDLDRLLEQARAGGARALLTTEKDGERLRHLDTHSFPVATVPLVASVEPGHVFLPWLLGRLGRA